MFALTSSVMLRLASTTSEAPSAPLQCCADHAPAVQLDHPVQEPVFHPCRSACGGGCCGSFGPSWRWVVRSFRSGIDSGRGLPPTAVFCDLGRLSGLRGNWREGCQHHLAPVRAAIGFSQLLCSEVCIFVAAIPEGSETQHHCPTFKVLGLHSKSSAIAAEFAPCGGGRSPRNNDGRCRGETQHCGK